MNKYREEQLKKINENLVRFTRKTDTIAIQYYIPDTDEWVYRFSKSVVKRTGYTQRHWYNKFILGVDDPDYYPKCFKEGCNNHVRSFKGTAYGYPMYCCLKHARDDDDTKPERTKSMTEAMNRPDVKLRKNESNRKTRSTKEWKEAQSIRSKEMWNKPGFREENIMKIPRPHSSVSKISVKCFNEISDLFNLFGVGGTMHYKVEHKVPVTRINDGKKSYRSLDFYSEGLNLIIEFMGSYYHPRDSKRFTENEINKSVDNDYDRMLEIYTSLSKSYPRKVFYLINIYEGEYRDEESKGMLMTNLRNMLEQYLITGDLESSRYPRLVNLNRFFKGINESNSNP